MLSRTSIFIVIVCLCLSPVVRAHKPQQPPSGGAVTGAPVNYTSKRTIGITDPKGPVIFEDVTDKTALANFKHRGGTLAKDYIFEIASGGVAILDYDGDGLPDIYLLNGSTLQALRARSEVF